MKKFVQKGFVLAVITTVLYLSLGFLADGYTDPFYLRFTSTKQHSLIIGTSRAAQGLQPKILNQYIEDDSLKPIYNFSFTVNHSPFGETYLNAIKHKLDTINTKKGLFIIAVDPWSIASRNDTEILREETLQLAKVSEFNSSPNFDYLFNAYHPNLTQILKPKFKRNQKMVLKEDGWLEINVPMDSVAVANRIQAKLDEYIKDNLPYYFIEENRISYLNETIQWLKKYGKVVLVRLPIHPKMVVLEEQLSSNFNEIITDIAIENKVGYINFMPKNTAYEYTDGNHIYKTSGEKLSKEIALKINKL